MSPIFMMVLIVVDNVIKSQRNNLLLSQFKQVLNAQKNKHVFQIFFAWFLSSTPNWTFWATISIMLIVCFISMDCILYVPTSCTTVMGNKLHYMKQYLFFCLIFFCGSSKKNKINCTPRLWDSHSWIPGSVSMCSVWLQPWGSLLWILYTDELW